MSDQTTIIEVDTRYGVVVVNHVVASRLNKHDIMEVGSHYEVLVDDVLKHESKDPEDIMRALGSYMAGLS